MLKLVAKKGREKDGKLTYSNGKSLGNRHGMLFIRKLKGRRPCPVPPPVLHVHDH